MNQHLDNSARPDVCILPLYDRAALSQEAFAQLSEAEIENRYMQLQRLVAVEQQLEHFFVT
jgi:hypothetical protein